MPGLLVIDDDEASCRLVRAIFKAEGIATTAIHDGASALERVAALAPDVVLLDQRMPGLSGLEVLAALKTLAPATPVVMVTADRDVKSAVRAMREGAFDYLSKPIDHDEVVVVVGRALERRALQREVDTLRRRVADGGTLVERMGGSAAIQHVAEQVETVAATNFSVLVLGETGTGKELVAHAIHQRSERAGQPFIALDCGALPEPLLESELFGHEKGAFTGADRRKQGQFGLAAGGTIFLDEIGNLPIGLQAKLLRVLESRQVRPIGGARETSLDVRFVAATNDDLQAKIAAGRFRADLYFRLAQYTITLPALRERRADIAHLATRFLTEVAIELRRPVRDVAPEARSLLVGYSWPGNVRELRNTIRQAVLETVGTTVTKATVAALLRASPQAATPERTRGRSLREVADAAARDAERAVICETLRATRGNKSQAARALATDFKTLHVKMKLLGIRARDFVP